MNQRPVSGSSVCASRRTSPEPTSGPGSSVWSVTAARKSRNPKFGVACRKVTPRPFSVVVRSASPMAFER